MSSETPVKSGEWFHETSSMWPGQAFSLDVETVLHHEKTEYQDLVVFKNKGPWGNVMLLDGCVQVTEKDEFVYHEMMAHMPLCSHPNPKKVLIIGGGDGGVMREVMKHPSVEHCDLVDIDGGVIEASKKFFPALAAVFSHPKTNTVVGDGFAFVGSKENTYDVIIVDSSDPEGPASTLFGAEFYARVKKALTPGGIVCSQGESVWLHLGLIERMKAFIEKDVGFKHVKYGFIGIPSYPCGSIGCLMASDEALGEVRSPLPAAEADKLQYYDEMIHRAAFCLPRFARHLNQ